MHWFREIVSNDLAGAAVGCISVAGVWWTFWPGYREKLRERREQRFQRLLELHVQLQEIRRWAGSQYDDSSHGSQWYKASWMVNPFPWSYVEHFNRLVIARDYPPEFTTALEVLERASRRFHDMLADQIDYLSQAPNDIGLRYWAVVAAAEWKGGQLTDDELAPSPDHSWLLELYQRNKAIHVVSIGGPGGNGLHEACRVATERLVETRTALQAGRDTRWQWIGHGMAGVLGLAGLLFLGNFWWSFFDDHFHPAPAPAASTTAPADTSHRASPDTSRAAAPSARPSVPAGP